MIGATGAIGRVFNKNIVGIDNRVNRITKMDRDQCDCPKIITTMVAIWSCFVKEVEDNSNR